LNHHPLPFFAAPESSNWPVFVVESITKPPFLMIKTPILALDGFSAFAQDHNIHTHEIS
jgi:hypothetical protein